MTCIKGMATQAQVFSPCPLLSPITRAKRPPAISQYLQPGLVTHRLPKGVCILESPTPGEEYSAWVRQSVPALQPKGERKDSLEINASLPLERCFFGQKGPDHWLWVKALPGMSANQKQTDNRGVPKRDRLTSSHERNGRVSAPPLGMSHLLLTEARRPWSTFPVSLDPSAVSEAHLAGRWL